ncbi:MAG: amidase family protein, partial [Deltaproteobacteria bacterium]|nr:amidase family protein [Deltaproteobacteria bacterium]
FAPARLEGQPLSRQLLGWLLTYPFNMVSSSPVASVPCGFTRNGLPVGLQIVGRPRADAAVLRASASFERARPWTRRRPPL